MTSRRALTSAVVVLVGLAVLQMAVPARTNPAVDPALELTAASAPRPVVDVIRRACYNCHSSETVWPWYARVPPSSWLVVSDVNEGRGQLNFSRWATYNPYDRADLLDKICQDVSEKKMPLWQYRLVHPAARLSSDEVAAICAWTKEEADRLTKTGN